ncbi:hypothetical protein [Oceanirhabdus sp. W0125-5]|uniref:hypothetical protein n=1 Tax=Oceanirhabdus sp. W0125-5 TaxID=2999116 RepID=UPI0022F336A4|nr:hypothetical protein [Oceanirhabdus sp. W0125-5]WBW98237.1 hypothetical protein OW730_05575 [Oceanirhabdus sp. W0125-5]
MKKHRTICCLSVFLIIYFFSNLITCSYADTTNKIVSNLNTNTKTTLTKDILSEKIMLQTTPIGSQWYYTNNQGENLLLVLNDIERNNATTNIVSFRGAYSEEELFSLNNETLYFEINFLLFGDIIIQVVWDSKSNSFIASSIHTIEDFTSKNISLEIDNIFSTFSLNYILVPDENDRKNMITDEICKNYFLGEKVIFSKQNDISMNWYRGIDNLNDQYYLNGAHHTILMMLDWLYSDKQQFKHRPIHMFSENDRLTDRSVKKAISAYSEHSLYPAEDITEELITHNLNNGHILILKINPSDISPQTNNKSHKNIYYNGTEHYIIIKGFAIIDNCLYFTTYDPFSLNDQYTDGSYKGKNRFYQASDILYTINNVGTDVYVIKEPKKAQ